VRTFATSLTGDTLVGAKIERYKRQVAPLKGLALPPALLEKLVC